MGKLFERIQHAQISRRDFLKGSAVATSAILLSGCGDSKTSLTETETGSQGASSSAPVVEVEPDPVAYVSEADQAVLEGKGEWIPAACWHNCGGRCVNKAYVVDGVVIRQKTDDTHEDTFDYPQNRACLRGRAQRQQVFGADRLKYPMKRKNWSPDQPNGELRGRDEWERISWDEAIDYIAGELKKAKEKYGNRSILYLDLFHGLEGGNLAPVLAEFGGYVDTSSAGSAGTFVFNPSMYGFPSKELNDRYDLQKADTIILYGHNPAWCNFGNPMRYLKEAYEAGVKFVFVGPEYNVSAAAFNAEWYPVRTATDTAFLLGVAYAMLEQDEEYGLIDWDFLNRNTVGFYKEHMPEDAKTDECFRDYVMGDSDGTPKTPEWASEICGTPADKIREFARLIGKGNNISLHSSASPSRNKAAENFPQLLMTVGCMGGHFGKEGNCWGHDHLYGAFNRGAALVTPTVSGWGWFARTDQNPVDDALPAGEAWSAVLTGKYHYSGQIRKVAQPCEEREIDIHVIIGEHNNYLQTFEGLSKGIEAYRKVDFAFTNALWLNTTAKYCDIVLPVTSRWERVGDFPYVNMYDRENVFIYRKICEPLYEAKDDYEIAKMLSDKLGLNFESHTPYGEKQLFFNKLASTIVMKEDGTYEPLLTITEEDIREWDCEGAPQEGRIPLKQFLDDGVYRVKRSGDDNFGYVAYKAFREDPGANPLKTASGKFEIYCQTKSDYFDSFNSLWPTYYPLSPLPKWTETTEGYTTSFRDWEKKEKGPYPYLVSNPHYLRRAHTALDNVPWLREAMQNPVFIAKADAEEKGVQTGDTVILWNDNGKILRTAQVTRRLMPGNITLPHGAAVDIDEETGIDRAGADNILCSPNKSTASGSNGWNSTLVDFAKYDGEPLEPDYTWPQRILFEE
jgi:anaerobic dimethyl sulfoxide reductase subunit A